MSNPFSKKLNLTIPADPVCVEFTYDGGRDRHRITMAVPKGMADKACAIRGFKAGNTFSVQGKPYLILTVTLNENYVDGISSGTVEMEMMALSKLTSAVLGHTEAENSVAGTAAVKFNGVTHVPDKPKSSVKSLAHLFQRPARKIIT